MTVREILAAARRRMERPELVAPKTAGRDAGRFRRTGRDREEPDTAGRDAGRPSRTGRDHEGPEAAGRPRGSRRAVPAGRSATPREASLLLAHVLGVSEAQLFARDRELVPEPQLRRFESLLTRRLRGEPVAYLIGEREFYGRPFSVDPRVLIPRPETELLVDEALSLDLDLAAPILDVGTGSGCLAVTLACELPAARVLACDLSAGALAVARHNAVRHAVGSRVHAVRSDLTAGLGLRSVGLVVSNPPYVALADAAELPVDVREFEPASALFAGPDGLAVLTRLLDDLRALRPGTPVLLEIGAGQAAATRELAGARSFHVERLRPDYAGIPRVAVLRRVDE